MAGREITKDDLKQAVTQYASQNEMVISESDTGFTLMPGDILVSLEKGKPKCQDKAVWEALCKILTDMKEDAPVRTPIKNAPAIRTGNGLTPHDIINYINPKATESEAYLFAEFCRRKGADPMTKQVYLVIYEGQNGRQANFIAGKEYFTEKAEAHPQFDGFEAGIIIRSKEGALERREGTFWIKDDEALVGGWAKVHRKDRKIASGIEVPFKDFDTGKNLWAKMPATMIRKVALVQALREAFPANFGGMYDRSEMDQAIPADYEVQGA